MTEDLIKKHRAYVQDNIIPFIKEHEVEFEAGNIDPSDHDQAFEFVQLLSQAHFSQSLSAGTQIIFTLMPHRPHFDEFKEDWINFTDQIEKTFKLMSVEGASFDEICENETMQEALEISDRLIQEFYLIGDESYKDREFEKTVGVMGLISLLNPFVFEPWLVQGIVHVSNKNYAPALFVLTMAGIVNFEHPAVHLLLSQVYLEVGVSEEAKNHLSNAKRFMSESMNPQWKKLYESLNAKLQEV